MTETTTSTESGPSLLPTEYSNGGLVVRANFAGEVLTLSREWSMQPIAYAKRALTSMLASIQRHEEEHGLDAKTSGSSDTSS
jgi:hypothetical protein